MITEPSYQDIDQCHSSIEGQNLLYNYGLETDALEPSCYFIPWITFDNVNCNFSVFPDFNTILNFQEWNEDEFNSALENLEGFLCTEKLSNVPECQ